MNIWYVNLLKKIQVIIDSYPEYEWDWPYHMRDKLREHFFMEIIPDDIINGYHLVEKEGNKIAKEKERNGDFKDKTPEEIKEIIDNELVSLYGIPILKHHRLGRYSIYKHVTSDELAAIRSKNARARMKGLETILDNMRIWKHAFQGTETPVDELLEDMRNTKMKMFGAPIEAEQ